MATGSHPPIIGVASLTIKERLWLLRDEYHSTDEEQAVPGGCDITA